MLAGIPAYLGAGRAERRVERGLLDSEQFAHWETGVHAEATAKETD